MKFPFEDKVDKSALFNRLQTEAHIWFFRTDVRLSDEQHAVYLSQLSVDEKQRYHRFHYEKDRKSYLVAHILLRNALSKYVDVPIEAWQFACNEHGKPEITRTVDLPEMSFNITHTEGLCACVITRGAASGIDAENVNRQSNYKGIAKRMFSADENAVFDVSKKQTQQFYKFWTLREAYVKALGVGLSGSSKEFSFALDDNDECISI
ncbi:MAG: 4'-phosphopantetheinyl transferase superfamily protein, partial [Gammaproteobacteria bacterium]|nr:4'-phosphopantetheinyl transferase superfamily protein [Gammaproteobacteria bacterium]